MFTLVFIVNFLVQLEISIIINCSDQDLIPQTLPHSEIPVLRDVGSKPEHYVVTVTATENIKSLT